MHCDLGFIHIKSPLQKIIPSEIITYIECCIRIFTVVYRGGAEGAIRPGRHSERGGKKGKQEKKKKLKKGKKKKRKKRKRKYGKSM